MWSLHRSHCGLVRLRTKVFGTLYSSGRICNRLQRVHKNSFPVYITKKHHSTIAGHDGGIPPEGKSRHIWTGKPFGRKGFLNSFASSEMQKGVYESPSMNREPQSGSTFVSSHFRIDKKDVENYLRRKALVFVERGDKLTVKECPFCHETHGKSDNMWKLFIWSNSGSFFCHRCSAKGSWFDFKRRLGDLAEVASVSNITESSGNTSRATQKGSSSAPSTSKKRKIDHKLLASYSANLVRDQFSPVLAKMMGVSSKEGQRGISKTVLQKYLVGAKVEKFQSDDGSWMEEMCVTFPWSRMEVTPGNVSNVTVDRVKVRSIRDKKHQRIEPKGGEWGLFGWHTVPPTADFVVLTEGEYDAMAVHQMTGMPAVSLPNGAGSLPIQILPRLERFKKIYLWMDDDVAGQEGAEKFARKLGLDRCYVVKSESLEERIGKSDGPKFNAPKDANEALLQIHAFPENERPMYLEAVRSLILESSLLQHKQIATFSSFRSEVFREFSSPSTIKGVQSKTLPALNKILKGHRKGELTILTGGTGVGKTTILSQLSLDYCQQGVNTLWGSFEIKNTRLAKKMLSQYAGLNLEKNIQLFDMWADRFEQLPMYFLRFFGSSDVDHVIDAMEYAVYVQDVEHIILDNLQFMMSGQGRGYDRFEMQDRAIEKFRQFATSKNVHVTLVVHPRKEGDGDILGLNSVFGSAKATQEADNVLIVQQTPAYRCLDVKKNRFDGETGSIPFAFNKTLQRVVQLSDKEARALEESVSQENHQEKRFTSSNAHNMRARRSNDQNQSTLKSANSRGNSDSTAPWMKNNNIVFEAEDVLVSSDVPVADNTARVFHSESTNSDDTTPSLAHDVFSRSSQ